LERRLTESQKEKQRTNIISTRRNAGGGGSQKTQSKRKKNRKGEKKKLLEAKKNREQIGGIGKIIMEFLRAKGGNATKKEGDVEAAKNTGSSIGQPEKDNCGQGASKRELENRAPLEMRPRGDTLDVGENYLDVNAATRKRKIGARTGASVRLVLIRRPQEGGLFATGVKKAISKGSVSPAHDVRKSVLKRREAPRSSLCVRVLEKTIKARRSRDQRKASPIPQST